MKILVTGGTGFIGGALARALVQQGHSVFGLARPASLHRLPEGVIPVPGDLEQLGQQGSPAAEGWLKGVDIVYHAAAARDQWGMPYSAYYRVNVEGTRALLQTAADNGVGRFVYCSSAGVAEHNGRLDADETLPYRWDRSKHAYHHTKMLAEKLVLQSAPGGPEVTVVRPCIAYGPGDEWGMVTRLAGLLQQGRYVMAGRGTGHIHLVYIDDLVRAMILAGTEPRVAGRVYIVAGPEPVRIAELVSLLCGLLPASLPRWRVPVPALMAAGSLIEIAYRAAAGLHLLQPTDTPLITRSKVYTVTLDRAFSTARVRDELGFEPMVGYQEGLSQTIVWCKSAGHLSASL